MNILLVDDEERMLDLLELIITFQNYKVKKVTSGMDAICYLMEDTFDLVLLDIMMPEWDGFVTCQRIRELSNVPIIMLTARDSSEDIVKGLELGADDYIVKPFDEKILLARIQAALRRAEKKEEIQQDGLLLKIKESQLIFRDRVLVLTPVELKIIYGFMTNPNKIFSRDDIQKVIGRYEKGGDIRTVDSHIRNIRDKFKRLQFPVTEYLKTVYGYGYRWEGP